jgi:RNA polymerase sigma-70 factor (ECF subfamily)
MSAEIAWHIERWPQTIEEFDHLVEATQDELVHFAAYRLGNREDAEDVVQDVYVQAFRDREKRRKIADVRPYLFRMTGNHSTDFLRARSRRLREKDAVEPVHGDVSDSLAMRSLVDQLPEREAEVIRLRAWSGLQFAEIAIAVNSPLATVKTRFRLGIERLRKSFNLEGSPK